MDNLGVGPYHGWNAIWEDWWAFGLPKFDQAAASSWSNSGGSENLGSSGLKEANQGHQINL